MPCFCWEFKSTYTCVLNIILFESYIFKVNFMFLVDIFYYYTILVYGHYNFML